MSGAFTFTDGTTDAVNHLDEVSRLEQEVVEAAVAVRKNELEQRHFWDSQKGEMPGEWDIILDLQEQGATLVEKHREACDRLISERAQ